MLKRVSVNAFAASGSFRVECSKFPKINSGGVSYLRRLTWFCDYSSIVTPGGGSTTPIQLHDLLAEVRLQAGGETWGPQNPSGTDLQALHSILGGPVQTSENVDVEGDEAIGALADVERQVVETFDYDLIGAEAGDFSPPVAYLSELGGALEVTFSAVPANTTSVAGNVTTYVETDEAPELRAVPPVRYQRVGLNALTNGSIPGGKLLALLLKRSSDLTDSIVDLWQLYADGEVVTDAGDPSWITNYAGLVGNAGAVGDNLQESGFDSLSGTRPRFLQLYPHRRYDWDRRSTKKVAANQFTYNLTSTLTASQFTFLSLLGTRLTGAAAIDQAAPCGICSRGKLVDLVKRDPAGASKPKTRTKVPDVADRHQGWLPIKFRVPPHQFTMRGR